MVGGCLLFPVAEIQEWADAWVGLLPLVLALAILLALFSLRLFAVTALKLVFVAAIFIHCKVSEQTLNYPVTRDPSPQYSYNKTPCEFILTVTINSFEVKGWSFLFECRGSWIFVKLFSKAWQKLTSEDSVLGLPLYNCIALWQSHLSYLQYWFKFANASNQSDRVSFTHYP